MKLKYLSKTLFFTLLSFFTTATQVYAQPVDLESTYFGGHLSGRTISYFINPLVRASMILAGIISFILVLGGGFGMIASAGNAQQQGKGKQAVTAGVAGLLIVISAYWILEIIQTLTGVDILSGSGL